MPALMPLPLLFDPAGKNWHLSSKKKPVKTLYWGVPLRPLPISPAPPPPGALGVQGFVTPTFPSILGPLIGILSSENQDGSTKKDFDNYKALSETGQRLGGIVFVFGPGSVDWKNNTIRGHIYDKGRDQWPTCLFPFPNVVYNRIQSRLSESRESSKNCIQRFLDYPGITLYNPGFFNKAEILSLLGKSSRLRKHLPETVPLESRSDLAAMLERHPEIYLKPANKSAGAGIIRLRKAPPRFTMHYYGKGRELNVYSSGNIKELWKKILQVMAPSPYILQQAIDLARVSTRPFDCRVLVQKNRKGLWQVSGLGIRIAAQAQSITTHVPRGGRLGLPGEVLQQAFPRKNPARLGHRVTRLCLAAAGILEKHYHPLGEMTIDVGLDRRGRPWLFEANAKPAKFDEPDIRKKQLAQVIRYAQFLTFKNLR